MAITAPAIKQNFSFAGWKPGDVIANGLEIVDLMEENAPEWRYIRIERGGHMAALTEPHLINPIVVDALA